LTLLKAVCYERLSLVAAAAPALLVIYAVRAGVGASAGAVTVVNLHMLSNVVSSLGKRSLT